MSMENDETTSTTQASTRIAGLSPDVWRRSLIATALAAAVLAPFIFEGFTIFQFCLVGIYAIAVLGLNLLTGFNGQFSLGHSAFYAMGAYTAAILIDHYEFNEYLTIPIAGIVCFVAGFLFGLPALRLEGLYLALATFALAVAMPQVLKSSHLESWTGGVQGIDIFRSDPPPGIPLNVDQWWYFVVLGVLLVMFWAARNLVNSRTGRAIMAIRDNPLAAQSMGINTSLYKSVTFGVSGLYTGVAGALAAIIVEFVAPDSFTLNLSILLLIGLVVGGLGSIPGCIFGGMFILYLPNIAEEVSKGLSYAVFGLILILVIYVMPSGAAGLARALVDRITRPATE